MEYKCSICLDTLFTADADVSVTPCRHAFHRTCIQQAMSIRPECPNCKCKITAGVLGKIHFDVFNELDHGDCSPATVDVLEEIKECEREKKISLLESVKALDKENKSLKGAYKENVEWYKTCKLFLRSFQKDRKLWQEKNQKLKLDKNYSYAKKRNDFLEKDSFDEPFDEVENDKNCEDIINKIDKMISKGMQSDSKSNEKSDMNVDLCSDKTVLYNGSSESIRNKLEEITNYDKNIYKLLLKHISNLENDNKKLKENNNTVLCYQNDLENYLKKAQNDVDNLKENFRMMQSENNKLLNSLKRLNISKNSEFELCRKRRKLSVNNRPIGKNSLESEETKNFDEINGTFLTGGSKIETSMLVQKNQYNRFVHISISGQQTEHNSLVPAMSNKRKNFGMCSFTDCIFVTGGSKIEKSFPVPKKTFNSFITKLNTKQLEWEHCITTGTQRIDHESTIVGENIYLVGGRSTETLSDTEVIPISGKQIDHTSWLPAMFYKRERFGMCSFADCIFVAGGEQNEVINKCEVYSLENSEWHEVASMNTKRCKFSLVYFQERVWAIGGIDGVKNFSTDTIETYDLSKNSWTMSDVKLLQKRNGHSAAVYRNKIFVVGGEHYGIFYSVEVYSSETNQFSFVTSMKIPRAFHRCCIVNSSLYVIGGYVDLIKRNTTKTVEIYDIEKDAWSEGPSLPFGLAGFACS